MKEMEAKAANQYAPKSIVDKTVYSLATSAPGKISKITDTSANIRDQYKVISQKLAIASENAASASASLWSSSSLMDNEGEILSERESSSHSKRIFKNK